MNPTPIFAVLAALILAACAQVSGTDDRTAQACQAHDWRAQGVSDGSAGFTDARIEEYRAQCGDNIDVAAWKAGRAEGAARFCTVEGAFKSGVANTPFREICQPMPAGAEEALEKGAVYARYTGEISSKEAEIYEHQITINRLRRDLSSVTGGNSGASPAARARINLLGDEIQRLQAEIRVLKQERSRFTL